MRETERLTGISFLAASMPTIDDYKSQRRSVVQTVRKPTVTTVKGVTGLPSAIRDAVPEIKSAELASKALNMSRAAVAHSERAASQALKSGLRFFQFFRAYAKAIAIGTGTFLLMSELIQGHFNPARIVIEHLFILILAPLYAVMLGPAAFALYKSLGQLGVPDKIRAYVIGGFLGALTVFSRLSSGNFLLEGDYVADAHAVNMLVCGLLAGYVFNRSANKIKEKEQLAVIPR
jgi:hypothetical protein